MCLSLFLYLEEAETDHYSELRSPSEDVYTEALFNESQQKRPGKFQFLCKNISRPPPDVHMNCIRQK